MKKITITENESGQRLDRFLKKYYGEAPLSVIYKMIRKDIKLNGKRAKEETMLEAGDELTVYISDEDDAKFSRRREVRRSKKSFRVAYEDSHILIAEKPFGLLTHGDEHEKKNHLTNQVITYLIDQGEYVPAKERTFTPAPANRLDRNTTGLVLFGKTAESLREAARMVREEGRISKFYLTIVSGRLEGALALRDRMEKDHTSNTVHVLTGDEGEGKLMQTNARPLAYGKLCGKDVTLVEVELITGRTHQIRAHMAKAGYPVIGDAKYGDRSINQRAEREYHLTTQFLHAYKLEILQGTGELEYLTGKVFTCPLPDNFDRIACDIFGNAIEQLFIGE